MEKDIRHLEHDLADTRMAGWLRQLCETGKPLTVQVIDTVRKEQLTVLAVHTTADGLYIEVK